MGRLLAIASASLLLVGVGLVAAAPAMAATGHSFLSQVTEAFPGTHLGGPEAVAVTKEGDLFVADPARGVVDVFDSAGAFRTEFGSGLLSRETGGIAVDEKSGDVYIAETGTDRLDVFKPNGSGGYELLSRWTGAATPATM